MKSISNRQTLEDFALQVLLIFSLLILTTQVFKGQTPPTFTQHFFEVEDTYDPIILSYYQLDNGNFSILKKEPIKGPGGWRYYLEIRDPEMTKKDVKDISFELDAENYIIEDYVLIENSLLIISSNFDKKNKSEYFYSQGIDLNTMKVSDRTQIYQTEFSKKSQRPHFEFNVSNDKSHCLITVYPTIKGVDSEVVSLFLMNINMETVWKKENFILETKSRKYLIRKTLVGNNGTIYMLGQEFSEMKDQIFQLFLISDSFDKSVKFEFEEEEIKRLGMMLNHENELVLTSYFYDENSRGVKGLLLTVFNGEDLSLLSKVKSDFDDDLVLLGMSQKRAEKLKAKSEKKGFDIGSYYLNVNSMFLNAKGELYVIGQEHHIERTTYTSSNGTVRTKTVYHYDDIYVSKFDQKGQTLFNAKVPYSIETPGAITSYEWFYKNDEINIVFLDQIENLDNEHLKTEGVMNSTLSKKGVFSYATIHEDGTTERNMLYDFNANGDKNFKIYSYDNDISSILMLIYKGKKIFNLGLVR